jgi:TPR repeat protein
MVRSLLFAALVAVMVGAAPARAAEQLSEETLRIRLQSASWPADIVRLANEYKARFPQTDFRPTAESLGRRADVAVRALERKDVQLYRNAFAAPPETADLRDALRRASLGDAESALRLAHAHRSGTGVPADNNRYVGWLQFAASLGHDAASYELAVHYRRNAQLPLASLYEARAVDLGYVPPRDLDHVRK